MGVMTWRHTYNIHGIPVQFVTDNLALEEATRGLMRYFQDPPSVNTTAVALTVRGVASRADIPIHVSDSAQALFTKTAQARGDLLRSIWQCTLYRDHGHFIADF